jgi:hypothetical protein
MFFVKRWLNSRRYKKLVGKILADPRYRRNVEYGEPRPGHPEGTVKAHLAELEANLEKLKPRLKSDEAYWKLKFLVHTHDTFKAASLRGVSITDPQSHASLARAFAAEFTADADLLNMIQFHDEGYALWRQKEYKGAYSAERFHELLDMVKDWDLFLLFNIIDGCTEGKDREKVIWFVREVKKYRDTRVDETWVLK